MLMRFGNMFTLTSGEYALNDEANRIDQLIVKNTDGIADDIIAEFFLPFNIMEFKSPRDRLGIREYHRAEAYAHLLIAYGCSLNGQYRDVGDFDVTITFVHEKPPRNLIRHLIRRGREYSNPYPGIHRLTGLGHIPIQIAAYGEMNDDSCVIPRAFRGGNIPDDMAEKLINALIHIDAAPNDGDGSRWTPLLRFLRRRHSYLFEEGTDMYEFAEELTAPKTRRLVAEGRREGRQKGILEGAVKTLCELVRDGILSLTAAAARAHMTEKDFSARMAQLIGA